VIETTELQYAGSGHTHSAVGRVTLLVDVDEGGSEKVTYERRWPDARAAREWCEQKLEDTAESASVLEIQVTEEVWGLRQAWEATPSRHVPQTLQLGMRAGPGRILWGAPHDVGASSSRRDG
jgi:hypothetical protein